MASKKITRTGFSLLELVIVIAVIATLLTMAIPSYRQYVLRGHRADAIRTILSASDCQGRVKVSTGFFDTSRCLKDSHSTRYDFSIKPADNPSADSFTITALPLDAEDDPCGALSLDHTGTRSISGLNGSVSRCWGGR